MLPRPHPKLPLPCTLLLATAWALPALAAEIHAGPGDDVESLIGSLGPGDTLILADGVYDINERFSFDIAGTADQPIIIRAADGARPHFRQLSGQNIWDIRATQVVIRGLEFSQGSAGLRVEAADHLTIEDCEIHDTADVAVRMNDSGQTYESVQILRNHIHDTSGTGEGMYLGCNSNACRLANALIANNHVHHTNGPGVSQGDGIELKEGSYGCVIRDNVIHDTGYPCILVYSAVGNGPANLIEGNALWACGDHGIQAAADATIRNNILLGAAADGIAMQPHQAGSPTNLRVIHNTIIQPANDAVSLRGVTGDVLVANNALYAPNGSAINPVSGDYTLVTMVGNVGVGGVAGGAYPFTDGDLAVDMIAANTNGGPPVDVFPAAGGALIDGGDPAHVTEVDFNGTDRQGQAHAGAYHYDPAGNPGWTLQADFKDPSGEPPDQDGSDGDAGLDGGSDAGIDAGIDAGLADGDDAGSDPGDEDPGTDEDDGGGDSPADAEPSDGAGSDSPDAGGEPDGTGEKISGGCGCQAGGRTCSLGWLALLLIGAQLSRRRSPPTAAGPF